MHQWAPESKKTSAGYLLDNVYRSVLPGCEMFSVVSSCFSARSRREKNFVALSVRCTMPMVFCDVVRWPWKSVGATASVVPSPFLLSLFSLSLYFFICFTLFIQPHPFSLSLSLSLSLYLSLSLSFFLSLSLSRSLSLFFFPTQNAVVCVWVGGSVPWWGRGVVAVLGGTFKQYQ